MITFVAALAALILGYILYGAFVERVFGADPTRKTPCYTHGDGVDYIPMPTWKVYLIQFLNIAGTGPIFGSIMGILFGPAAYLWIVFGSIFGGAVHDYLSGMISIRKDGMSLPEIVGDELGSGVRQAMRLFSLVLMVLVGTVFVTTPAGLLATMTVGWGPFGSVAFWSVVIFIYYILATLLPIDALIGRIYPVFGVALLIMAVGVLVGIFTHTGWMPEITEAFTNHHPNHSLPIFPMLFITIACGAVSGFHATQSPMMARCIKNERMGRRVFYGAMITEGIVAMIWAAAAIKYAGGYDELQQMLTAEGNSNPALVVNFICNDWMGGIGAILAILGVVAAPVTSGDTAFRSARLIVADFMGVEQRTLRKRIYICIPLFALGLLIIFGLPFQTMWSYFAWMNQTLAAVTLWMIVAYLRHRGRAVWVGLIPALVMTYVCASYIFVSPLMLGMQNRTAAYLLGGGVTLAVLVAMIFKLKDNDAKGIS